MNKKTARADATQQTAERYELPQQVISAIEWAESSVALRESIDAHINGQAAKVAEAEAGVHLANQALAEAEANLVLSDTEEKSLQAERLANEAGEHADKMQLALERCRRISEALCQKAMHADAQIAEAKSALDAEMGIYTNDMLATFSDELNAAIKPLVDALVRGQALYLALRNPSLGYVISEVKLLDPMQAAHGIALVDSRGAQVDGEMFNWTEKAVSDPYARAISQNLLPVQEIKRKIASHKPFVHPNDRPKPYVRKGYTTEGVTREHAASAAAASSESDETAAARMPSTVPRQPMSRSRASVAQPQELNIGAVLSGILPQSLVQS